MRGSWIGLLTVTVAIASSFSISCGHKPAYSEIQSKDSKGQRATEQPASNPSDQAAAPAAGETQAASPGQPVPPVPQPEMATNKPAESRIPAFIDQTTGQFKDLPSYPNSQRISAQVGPIAGVESAMFILETTESFQTIAAFYDKAIKKNGWTIAGHTRDPEYLKWELMKGKTSEAIIEVKGEASSPRKGILISRAERPPAK